MPEISVIIPVYNVSSHLRKCLDSVLAQTFRDFEAICINDGSTDKSLEILNEYQKKDSRIIIISQKNQGVSHARNIGIEKSSAPYITFIDSDDEIQPQLFSVLLRLIKEENTDISGCYIKYSSRREVFKTFNENQICKKIYTDPFGAFMRLRNLRTEVFARLYKKELLSGFRFTEGIRFEDVPFSCMVINSCKSMVYTPEKLYLHYNHRESFINSEFTADKARDYAFVMKQIYAYFAKVSPARLNEVRKYIINRRFKMVLNQIVRRQKNPEKQLDILRYFQKEVKQMYADGILSCAGLNPKHRIQLYLLLHCDTPDSCLRFSRIFSLG